MSEAGAGLEAVILELPENVRNQIAAGEVVERPASVAKELVENALDAGARRIQVDLEQGGAALVRVADDGCGMVAEDVAAAFRPHATSKLREVSDLDHIASLGFRGEALASIGSVARCSLYSRPAGAQTGQRIENEGGRLTLAREAGGPLGTVVEVRDLFYNTPARRRFLKRPATELSRVLDVLQRLALGHPGVGFAVTHDGKRVLEVEPGMDLLERVRRLFGAELAAALAPVSAADGDVRLLGYVAPPRFARRDSSRQMWFLNGRFLRDRVLVRALREGFRGFLDGARQPVAFLHLHAPPDTVDVNVHPTKAEVRLRDERRLFGFIVLALRRALQTSDASTPGATLLLGLERRGAWQPAQEGRELPWPLVREAPPRATGPAAAAPARSAAEPAAPETEVAGLPAGDRIEGPFLQVERTYLLRALPGGFEIIDQHALHERLTFETLKARLRAGRLASQRFLVPELVELSRAEIELLRAHLEALPPLGIELDLFGGSTVAVHALPAELGRADAAEIVRALVAALEEGGRAPAPEDLLEELLHRRACRASVMAGDALSQEEIRALLERARTLASDQTCPHGRPTRVRFTLAELEKAFHRR